MLLGRSTCRLRALHFCSRHATLAVPSASDPWASAICVLQVPHLGQREALSIQFRKQQPSRSHASATPFSGGAAQSGSRSRSGGGSFCSEPGTCEGGSSESGGSEGPCKDAGRGNSWGGSEAGDCWGPPRSEQHLSGGRALVVKNLPPSLPYEAVRVFFSQ